MCAQQHRRVGGRELDAATLFARAQNGCVRSLDQLMCQHDGLVQAVVRRQVLGDLSFEEALQAGRIGLWRAILGYDPSRGLAFSTYAWPAIMRYVWQAVKVQRREQGHARVAKEAVGATADPVETVVDEAVYRALDRLVQGLPERLRDVVVARYGLGAAPPAFYREIGASLGVSGEWARRLHEEALARLRHPAVSQTLRDLRERHTQADYEMADALGQRWLRQRGGRRGR